MSLRVDGVCGCRPQVVPGRLPVGPYMPSRAIILVLAFLCLPLLTGGVRAEDVTPRNNGSVPTNLDVVERLVREAVDELIESAPVSPDDTIHVRACGKMHRLEWVVQNYLLARLATDVKAVYIAEARRDTVAAVNRGPAARPGKGRGRDDRFDAQPPATEEDAGQGDSSDASLTGMMSDGDVGQEEPGGEQDTVQVGPGGSSAEDVDEIEGGPASVIDPETMKVEAPPEVVSEAQGLEEKASGTVQEPQYAVAPQTGKMIEFRIGELEVRYPRRWRGSLFGSALVERSVKAVIFFTLLDNTDGRVLWVDSGRAASVDVVSQKMLADLEVPEGGGARADTDAGGLGRMVEPIVVSGIVISLVFLFYSSRT